MSTLPSYRETLISICQEIYADMVWFTWEAADLAMAALAERNPACADIVQFHGDGNPDVFLDSPNANINLLHKLLWDGVDVSGELCTLRLMLVIGGL